MSTDPRDLRFGILVGKSRSRCWRVRAGAKVPELFIEREGLEKAMHLSLHHSGQWHVRVHRRAAHEWRRPAELTPGFTRAAVIVLPNGVATIPVDSADDMRLFVTSPDGNSMQFNILIERPGANPLSWPGKNAMGTEFVGRIPLARASGSCCVVAHQAAIPPGSATFPRPSEAEAAEIRQAVARGDAYMTLFGEEPDGAIVMMDVRLETVQPGS